MATDRSGRLTYANVMSSVAAFLALGGAGAYAANEWTGDNIVDESLYSVDLRNGQVAAADLASQAVTTAKLRRDAVRSDRVLDGSLGGADIAESTLGIVPNADRLDGLDSKEITAPGTAFVNSTGSEEPIALKAGGDWTTVAQLAFRTDLEGVLSFDGSAVQRNVGKSSARVKYQIVHNGHAHAVPSAGIISPERDALGIVNFLCNALPGEQRVTLQARATGSDVTITDNSFSAEATRKLDALP